MKLIFLAGSRSSSTEFVHSLIDGHPKVLAVPFPMMFHYFWRVHGKVAEQGPSALFEALCKKSGIAMVLSDYNDPDNPYMEKDNRSAANIHIDLERFHNCFIKDLNNSVISRRNTFLAFYHSYAEAIGHPWQEVDVILENSHNTFYHREILEDFSDAFFISPIRDPHAIFASCRKGRFGDVYEGLSETSMLMHLYQTFINQWVYSQILGPNRYYLIKNEMIHQNKRACMEELANWCGIEFNEILMQSTFANSPWEGNSAYRKGSDKGVFRAVNGEKPRWVSELSESEIRLVELLFGDFIRHYEYKFYLLDAKRRSYNDFLVLLRPVKNQMNLIPFRWKGGKAQWGKISEYIFFPLYRVFLLIFYSRVLKSLLLLKDPMEVEPNQDICPKIRFFFSYQHKSRRKK